MNSSLSITTSPRLAWLGAGLAAGLLAATLAGPALTARAQSDTQTQDHTINVTGTGRVFVTPDVADVVLGVTVQEREAADASNKAATAMDAVIKALLALGIAEKDIQTTQLTLSPVYDYDNSPPNLTGWQADNLVQATVRDVSKVGKVIDSAVKAGATNVQGVNFRVEDPSEAESTARKAAVADARAKADELASAANVTIVSTININESSGATPQPIYMDRAYASAAGGDMAPTPVLAGQSEIDVTVFVTYGIE